MLQKGFEDMTTWPAYLAQHEKHCMHANDTSVVHKKHYMRANGTTVVHHTGSSRRGQKQEGQQRGVSAHYEG